MDVQIRVATLDDLPHLLRHRLAMFEDMGKLNDGGRAEVERASREYFQQALAAGTYKAWLAEQDDGRILAGGGLVIAAWPGYPGESHPRRAWILNVYTEPGVRRQGLARRVMQVIINWCRENGFYAVSLHASDAGRPLYESMGFQNTNEMRLTLG
jgi:GNAT superfamily N-acetyltransferase